MEVVELVADKPIRRRLSSLGIGFEIMMWENDIPSPYQTIVEPGNSRQQAYYGTAV